MPPAADDSAKRPNGTSSRDELAYYKTQYEQLESELADFQASSRDLEAELERDIEASEKRERQLKEKVESLRYEVDEWKVSYLAVLSLEQWLMPNRPSASSPRPKAIRRRMHCKRRLRPYETPTARFS